MNVIIRHAKILDAKSGFHQQTCDVHIRDGMIAQLAKSVSASGAEEIDGKNCYLSPGFFDLHVNFREPGAEYKEDLKSGCKAAMAGGFTGVLQMPDTNPVIQSKAGVEMIRTRTKDEMVDVFVAGALSIDLEGKDLTEMFDLHTNGAVCFTNDKHAVQDAGLMTRALLYTRNFNGIVLAFPNDNYLAGKGQMNEGVISTQLGLRGIPALAEELMLARDLMLCRYTGARIHFSTISTKGAVEQIRKAKADGLAVTCDVAAHHLSLDETSLLEFDTRFKTEPPLRTKDDIAALKEGLIDGTIDAICSDHQPEDIENKQKEFDLAAFGAEGIETAFAAAFTALKDKMKPEQIIEKFSAAPRNILSIPVPKIAEGEQANLTLFNPNEEWEVTLATIFSKSKNNPFIGKRLTGKIKAVFNKNQFSRY